MNSFDLFKKYCKHCKLGCEDGCYSMTCRHESNVPRGCAWGECRLEKCPFLRESRTSGWLESVDGG